MSFCYLSLSISYVPHVTKLLSLRKKESDGKSRKGGRRAEEEIEVHVEWRIERKDRRGVKYGQGQLI